MLFSDRCGSAYLGSGFGFGSSLKTRPLSRDAGWVPWVARFAVADYSRFDLDHLTGKASEPYDPESDSSYYSAEDEGTGRTVRSLRRGSTFI